jgi:type IV pilus assembly protein PilM
VFGKNRSVVGLDIGSSAIKAVELKPSGRSFKVVGFGVEPVPPDSIVDGAIIDGAAVADSIRKVFEVSGLKTKDVAASLSGNAVIVKKISLPPMTAAELGESIYWEAEQYIPFAVQDVNLDYQVLSGAPDTKNAQPASGTGMEVLLVAAKKEKIADYTGVITQAGRVPVVMDVDAFALQNAFEVNYGLEPGAVVALINAGASAININVISGEESYFTRDISIGGNAYTEALQKELHLSHDQAEQLKRGTTVHGTDFSQARPILRAVTDNVLLEVQKTFDFFRGTTGTDRIDRLMLSGGTSRVEGFAEMLSERFDAEVEMFDPFKNVSFDAARFGVQSTADVAATTAVAVINLLAVERKPVSTGIDPAQKITIGCSLLLVGTVALIGWRFWSLQQESARLDADIIAAQTETERLRSVLDQVAIFERRKGQLQQRVALIEELRKGQTGPVHLLDEVSRALPDRLWLVQLQEKEGDLRIEGRTTSLTALSDFVGNLETSGYFARPVEILDSQVETQTQQQQAAGGPGDLVRFTVKARFTLPGATPIPAPGTSAISTTAATSLTAQR